MIMNEKRPSAVIIEFPLNARLKGAFRREAVAEYIDPRVADALDPAWYHTAAAREERKPN